MAAMKPRTGDGPLEVTKEGRGLVMRVPLEGGGRLVVELSPDEASALAARSESSRPAITASMLAKMRAVSGWDSCGEGWRCACSNFWRGSCISRLLGSSSSLKVSAFTS